MKLWLRVSHVIYACKWRTPTLPLHSLSIMPLNSFLEILSKKKRIKKRCEHFKFLTKILRQKSMLSSSSSGWFRQKSRMASCPIPVQSLKLIRRRRRPGMAPSRIKAFPSTEQLRKLKSLICVDFLPTTFWRQRKVSLSGKRQSF